MIKNKANSRLDFRVNKNIAKSKRSQEEIVGFVLIVVLVTIIALIFLAISIRKAPETSQSSEVEAFMQSAMKYSTDCYSSAEARYDLKDLIKACYESRKCLDGREACRALNSTVSGMLDNSWKPGADNPVKAYRFKIYNIKTNKTIINMRNGNCIGNIAGTPILIPTDIRAELEICS